MTDGFSKRLAAQIASQLPEDNQEALRVLSLAREIIVCLGGGWAQPASVTQLFGSERIGPVATQAAAQEDPIGRRDISSPG